MLYVRILLESQGSTASASEAVVCVQQKPTVVHSHWVLAAYAKHNRLHQKVEFMIYITWQDQKVLAVQNSARNCLLHAANKLFGASGRLVVVATRLDGLDTIPMTSTLQCAHSREAA